MTVTDNNSAIYIATIKDRFSKESYYIKNVSITSPYKTDTLDNESLQNIKVNLICQTECGEYELKYRDSGQENPSDP